MTSMWDAAYGFSHAPQVCQECGETFLAKPRNPTICNLCRRKLEPSPAAVPSKPEPIRYRNPQSAYRARLKARGICIRSSKRNPHPAREGKATCSACNAQAVAAMKAKRALTSAAPEA